MLCVPCPRCTAQQPVNGRHQLCEVLWGARRRTEALLVRQSPAPPAIPTSIDARYTDASTLGADTPTQRMLKLLPPSCSSCCCCCPQAYHQELVEELAQNHTGISRLLRIPVLSLQLRPETRRAPPCKRGSGPESVRCAQPRQWSYVASRGLLGARCGRLASDKEVEDVVGVPVVRSFQTPPSCTC